jgi:hypothetical protein
MTARALKAAAAVLAALVVWLYVPPFGDRVSLPDLEPLLDPGVPHATPEFIDTGEHVYYCVRLTVPVPPDFSWRYFQRLHEQGVQFHEMATSPHLPIQRRKGWKIAFAWEKGVEPYVVGYRKSTDMSPWFPIKLRWPWLYFRLGRDVLTPIEAAVVPEADRVVVGPLVPRYPGSVLVEADLKTMQGDIVEFRFVARAEARAILDHYADFMQRHFPERPYRDEDDVSIESPSGDLAVQLGRPVAIGVHIGNMLFTDYPLVVFAPEEALKLPKDTNVLQPEGLRHLPFVSIYFLRLRYPDRTAALQAARIFGGEKGATE